MNELWPHRCFEAEAARHPEAVALVYQGGQLSYGDLDRRANQLAHHLQALGVGPDVVVALVMDCSPELVAANLAVFKAGGTAFLLPPATPATRLSRLLERTSPGLVVTSKQMQEREPSIAPYPVTAPVCLATNRNLAQLFLTSGSTGEPKIVMEPYIRARPPQQPPEPGERHLLKSNTGTTFTAAEIMAVMSGVTVFIAPGSVERDMAALASFIGEHRITHLTLVPSALAALLALDDLDSCRSLRAVHCAGEMIPPRLRRMFFDRLKARLLVSYGCTEARGATSRCCSPGEDFSVPDVGRPDPAMEAYVLDPELRPTATGVSGEIYLGGQIAAGYLSDPAATAERFVPHPFSQDSGARLFRTGDVGCWLPDGNLRILGRMDDQVKIRGFRIEPAEVEAALSRHPGVLRNAVIAREDVPGERRLVAYLVTAKGHTLTPSELRSYLQETLPEPMLPSLLIILDEMPLLPNGKIDRRSLPPPASMRCLTHAYVAPRTAVEERLAGIWARLLRVEPVGVHDNFFELGGHSLLATQLLSRLRAELGAELSVRALFDHPTIAELAAHIPA